MPDLGKHVVGTHEFDLDGVWLSPSTVAIAPLSDCFEEGLGTGVINDGAIGRFMRPNVAFANRFFDETLRIPAPLLVQKAAELEILQALQRNVQFGRHDSSGVRRPWP